jgi:DNA-directed RNA polymerase subunit H (RpoH/RPB5)
MTPFERELRRKMTGLKISFRRTMNSRAIKLPGHRGKLYRDKAEQLRKEMRLLRQQIAKLAEAPIELTAVKPGRYRHYKGKEYEVVGIARHSETLEELVVYRALYGVHGLWVRPRKMFQESVVFEGRRVPRFEWVGAV